MSSAAIASGKSVPLCVDLDGTLIRTDLLWESVIHILRHKPLTLFQAAFWLLRGRACLKAELARRVTLNPATLPYNEEFLQFLRAEKAGGRAILLVTASDKMAGEAVARHLGIFDEVLASDGQTNLKSAAKAALLVRRFGEGGFDYAGNSSADHEVWHQARTAVVVNARTAVKEKAQRSAQVGRVFARDSKPAAAFIKALRPHQWIKNLLLLVPLVTSHKITEPHLVWNALLGFVVFSLCASGVYILNDLFDLESDRHHATKRNRPFASGSLPLPLGLVTAPLLIGGSALCAWALSPRFAAALAFYCVLALVYACWLKKITLVDVFCLAGLYTVRLIAGHEATGIACTYWLLLFSIFIFLSLALLKRFVELHALRSSNETEIRGRGYLGADVELVSSLGPSSGYLSVLVLALYVNSQEVRPLYSHPNLLLLICPLLLYWISRVWLIAHRGKMHGDPIVFALKDRTSYFIAMATLAVLWAAAKMH